MNVIATFSGGLDSTVLLYQLRCLGHNVKALSIHYGQRHVKELFAAKAICNHICMEHRIADLSALKPFLAGSSQTDSLVSVPEGHYAEESMKATVVPNRNMLILATATAWAVSSKSDAVAYAAHSGDHAIYPDCRPEFAEQLGSAIALCDWHPVSLLRPFVNMTKAEIVRLGAELKVPFEKTWSCYQGRKLHCGKCGTCVERLEAFQLAGFEDPAEYE